MRLILGGRKEVLPFILLTSHIPQRWEMEFRKQPLFILLDKIVEAPDIAGLGNLRSGSRVKGQCFRI